MMRILSVLFLGLFMAVLTGSALADQPLSKTARENAAKKACALGDYQKGAEILTDLLVETGDPNFIYNQARCYQQNGRWEQSINRFREFLRKAKDLSKRDRAETEQQLADCESSLAKAAQVAPPPVAPTPPVPTTRVETLPPAPGTTPPGVSSTVSSTPSPSDGSRGKGLRVTGIVLASVGVAAVATGVILALKANSLSTKDYSRSREDERSSLKTGVWVSDGVGAAAVATGAILYIVGWPSDQPSSVALLPVVTPNEASVLLRGRF
jgi:tetratricopeptide (TPR) repeat protein